MKKNKSTKEAVNGQNSNLPLLGGKKEKSVQGTQKKQQKGSSIMMQICLKDTDGSEPVQQGIVPYSNPFELGHEQKQHDFMLLNQMQQMPESQPVHPQGFFQSSLADP